MLVTMSIFAIVSTLFLTIFIGSKDMESKSIGESDAFRAIAITQEAIKEELKRARVITPVDGEIKTEMELYRANFYQGNGEVVITDTGLISWDDCSENDTVESDCIVVDYAKSNNLLVRTYKNKIGSTTETRTIADLGKDGYIEFARDGNILNVKIAAYGYPYSSKNLPPSYFTVETKYIIIEQ